MAASDAAGSKAAPRHRTKAADLDTATIVAKIISNPSAPALTSMTVPELKCFLKVPSAPWTVPECLPARRICKACLSYVTGTYVTGGYDLMDLHTQLSIAVYVTLRSSQFSAPINNPLQMQPE